MTSQKIKMLSGKCVTDTTKSISNFVKKLGETLMDEFYKVSTYSGIFFVALIGFSWAISLLDKTGEA